MGIIYIIIGNVIIVILVLFIAYIVDKKPNNIKIKDEQKEKILNTTKIILIVLWNILKWTLIISITLIVGLFSILSGTKLYSGAIQKRKTYKPTRNFWNKG